MNSLSNRCRLSYDFMQGRRRSSGMPIEFSIELTNKCNLKCMMCPREENPKRGLGTMTFETFQKIIDQASEYLEFTYLHLAGEPLLHPHLEDFIDYAASKGVATGVSTNGTLLNLERAKSLLESRLSNLIISLDGTDAATYKMIRGAASFDQVVANAEQFLRMKKRSKGGPHTSLQMICMRENRHQTKEFVRYWQAMGVDAVRLKRFFNFAGTVSEHGYGQPETRCDTNDCGKETGKRPPCFLLWRQMAFYHTGDAVSCCHDFRHQTVLGNIHNRTLGQIWNSTIMMEMREQHVKGQQYKIPLCGGCNQPRVNLVQLIGLTGSNASFAKRLLILLERLSRLAGIKTPY